MKFVVNRGTRLETLKPFTIQRSHKKDRERKVLFALVEYYIQTGKPVGSNTLKEVGIEELSSATIRNYFVSLESEGYLIQMHTSGGRVPTCLAYRTYAQACLDNKGSCSSQEDPFSHLQAVESKEIAQFLQRAAEDLSQKSHCAVVLSTPRFDRDFVTAIRLMKLDSTRCLAVLVTDFGLVRTEILPLPENLTASSIERLERYFQWRLNGLDEQESLQPHEEIVGQNFYKELMLRYIVGHTHFANEELYRTGFSQLLHHADFAETNQLTNALSLFEDTQKMRHILKECMVQNKLRYWMGDDLFDDSKSPPNCTVLAVPYSIHLKTVGSVGLIGPLRIPYPVLFHMLHSFEKNVSESLTRIVYKFKISYRMPQTEVLSPNPEGMQLICKK